MLDILVVSIMSRLPYLQLFALHQSIERQVRRVALLGNERLRRFKVARCGEVLHLEFERRRDGKILSSGVQSSSQTYHLLIVCVHCAC